MISKKGNSVTKAVKKILGHAEPHDRGVKKLAYFAGTLSGHCKIHQVTLEAQVVQAVQCSSQNLQKMVKINFCS